MMTEIWWKVFLASIITVIIAKFFGSNWDIFLIFSVSFIAWTIGFILLILAAQGLESLWKKLKRRP